VTSWGDDSYEARGKLMSEQISGTHGPAEDDAIKRQDRDELQEHGEEWPEPDADDDESDTTWAATGRFAGDPSGEDWEAIELRSELARHLDRATFPATQAQLLETLTAHQAQDRLLDLVSSLPPDGTYGSLLELLQALGIPKEERRS
jgi:Protein of unknown function (DUF2795)